MARHNSWQDSADWCKSGSRDNAGRYTYQRDGKTFTRTSDDTLECSDGKTYTWSRLHASWIETDDAGGDTGSWEWNI